MRCTPLRPPSEAWLQGSHTTLVSPDPCGQDLSELGFQGSGLQAAEYQVLFLPGGLRAEKPQSPHLQNHGKSLHPRVASVQRDDIEGDLQERIVVSR